MSLQRAVTTYSTRKQRHREPCDEQELFRQRYQSTTRTHTKLTVALSSAIAQTTLRRTPTQLLLHQNLVQTSSVPAVIAEQALAPQQRAHMDVRERAFGLPANRTSDRLRVAELAFWLSQSIGGKWFKARVAGEGHGHVA